MATINISDLTHHRLIEAAAAMHLPLEQYLNQVAAQAGGNGHSQPAQTGTAEWTKAFEEWVASHPARGFVADDSRDSIYGDERE